MVAEWGVASALVWPQLQRGPDLWCLGLPALLQVPEELQDKEFAAVLQEEPLQPLALEPLTEEEQVGPVQAKAMGARLGEPDWSSAWLLTPTPGCLLRGTSPCQ